jgi:hypothetical protein
MSTSAEEAAYCTDRIARSTALAEASTDSCARASHVGIAKAYGDRLAALDDTETASAGTPASLDNEVDEPSRDQPSSDPDGELPHLRASVVALENVVVAMLAGGSSDQRAAVHDMALFVKPLVGAPPDHTTDAAEMMDHIADRSALFASVRT